MTKTKNPSKAWRADIIFRAINAYFKGRSLLLLEPTVTKWLKKLHLSEDYHVEVDLRLNYFTVYLVDNLFPERRVYRTYDPR